MREAEKAAADVAMRLYKMRGNVSKRYAQFTAIFINLTKEGRAVGQWQIDSIVVEYRKLLMVYIGAQKHNIDVVDFIDMVLYELAQIAMRGAA